MRTPHAPCSVRECSSEAKVLTADDSLLCTSHVLPDEPLSADWRTDAEREEGADPSYLGEYLAAHHP